MPNRILRDGILTSERVNQLSEPAELFYRRLMSVTDDHGRYYANRTLLRAHCYPLKVDSVTEVMVSERLAECQRAGLLIVYVIDGTNYLQLCDYGQRVQSKSKFPGPPTDIHGGSPCATVENRLGEGEGEGVVGDEGETGAPRSRKKKGDDSIPLATWLFNLGDEDAVPVGDPIFQWAAQQSIPAAWLGYAWSAFEERYTAEGAKQYTNWRQVFRKAVKEDWLRLWRMTPQGPVLTTVGEQWRRANV